MYCFSIALASPFWYFLNMKDLVSRFKALGETNRFRICMMLLEKPLCVCELLSVLEIAGGTLSNHLKILKNAGLIDQRKDGKWVEYFIADEKAMAFLRSASSFAVNDSRIEADRTVILSSTRESCTSGSCSTKAG